MKLLFKNQFTKINKIIFFFILVDETTRLKTVEQFSLCMRFVQLMSNRAMSTKLLNNS